VALGLGNKKIIERLKSALRGANFYEQSFIITSRKMGPGNKHQRIEIWEFPGGENHKPK